MTNKKFNIFEYLVPKNSTSYLLEETTVRQALEKFDYHKFSVVPIISSDGDYVCSISEGDLLRFIKNCHDFDIKEAEKYTLKDVKHHRSYKPLTIDASLEEIMVLSLDQNFIPVLDDRHKYIGIIKRRTIIQYLMKNVRKLENN